MKILFLCHRMPFPPNKGEKIRAFYQLRALAARHEVDLFTLADDPADMGYRVSLAPYCRRVTAALLHPTLARIRALPVLFTDKPLTTPCFRSAQLQAQVRKALATEVYDRIFVYCSAMAQYVDSVEEIPVIVDLVDVDSDKWSQYAAFTRFPFSAIYRRESRCLARYERRICDQAACVLVSTEREAAVLRRLSAAARVRIVPNGVDTSYFDPSVIPPEPAGPTVVFTGDMSYFPNEEAVIFFARKVLPRVRRSVPGTRFLIVGRKPGAKVRELERLGGVTVTGFVPDVREYLAKAQLATAPFSIAAGIQNKILEALSYGLPVVATRKATQGLSPRVGELVETGETADELAERTIGLLRDREAARRKGLAGRARVAEEYRWDVSLERFMDVVESGVPA